MRSFLVICGLLGLLQWRWDDVEHVLEAALLTVTTALP